MLDKCLYFGTDIYANLEKTRAFLLHIFAIPLGKDIFWNIHHVNNFLKNQTYLKLYFLTSLIHN